MSDAQPAVKDQKAPHKSARRRAREFAVQGLYQWQLTGDSIGSIDRYLQESSTAFVRADRDLYRAILFGAIQEVAGLKEALVPHVDRILEEVSPVELAILLASAYEIVHMPQTPYPVIVNEAIELAKTFGGTDGHKFINGVLDKLAAEVRAAEVKSARPQR